MGLWVPLGHSLISRFEEKHLIFLFSLLGLNYQLESLQFLFSILDMNIKLWVFGFHVGQPRTNAGSKGIIHKAASQEATELCQHIDATWQPLWCSIPEVHCADQMC